MSIQETAGKMVGPLPLGAWAIVITGAVWWGRSRRASGADSAALNTAYVDNQREAMGNAEVGPGNYGSEVVSAQNPNGTGAITTNDEWAREAITQLVAHGYTPTLADQALRDYLAGAQLDSKSAAMIDAAIKYVGAPPMVLSRTDARIPINTPAAAPAPKPTVKKPVSTKPKTPSVVQTKKPKPVKRAVPQKTMTRKHTVKRGENLSSIGRKYGKTWQQVYAANRTKISNPNLIYPGQILIIPN